jgi:hypothetical protein
MRVSRAVPGGPTDNTDAEEPDGPIVRHVVRLIEAHKECPCCLAAIFHRPHVPFDAPELGVVDAEIREASILGTIGPR